MRGIMISFTIILFVFSVSILNTVDNEYKSESTGGISLFGWTADETNLTKTDNFDEINSDDDSTMNATYQKYGTASSNPDGIVDFAWYTITAVYQGVTFLIDVVFKSSLGFSNFVQYLGHECPSTATDCHNYQFVPNYLANTAAIFVNLMHVLVIIQFVSNRNLKAGI